MALFELSMVTGQIVKMSTQGLIKKWSREETVIKLLKKLKLDREPDRDDFGHIYRFALVEWGVFKPAPLVEFFREEDIEKAFRQFFHNRDQETLDEHTAGYYEYYVASGKLNQVETDPRLEFDVFHAVFEDIVSRTRPPAGVKRDWNIAEISSKIDELLQLIRQQQLKDEADTAELLAPYLTAVVRRNRNLPLATLDPAQESTPIDLGEVFINLDAGLERVVLPGAQPGRKRYEQYSAALAHIHEKEHIVLLGDPGSGKSTLLRFLAYCLAQHALYPRGGWLERLRWGRQVMETEEEEAQKVWAAVDERQPRRRTVGREEEASFEEIESYWSKEAPLPIFIELRNFARTDFIAASPLALWDYFCGWLEAAGLQAAVPALAQKMRRGKLIFLLDGVDEVSPEDRPRIWQAIAALIGGACGRSRWAATCRVLSFAKEEAPQGVPVQTLQPLNEAQITQFIVSWYQALVDVGSSDSEDAESKTRNLNNAVQRPRLRELAENPMLLTIMALVQSYYGTLPDERARLYQMCVEILLLRWQRGKEKAEGEELPQSLVPLGDQQQLERLLWEIAWEAHSKAKEREKAADIPEMAVLEIARKHLGSFGRAEQFTEYTEERAHLLVGRGGIEDRHFTFPHRTFQEYLAACHLASRRRFPHNAAELASEGDTWREVLNLAAGTLVFNQNNREKALDGIEKVLPAHTPAETDEAGWFRVWMAAEMALVVGRESAEQDEVGADLLPRLLAQLAALVSGGLLTPQQRAEAGAALGWLGDPRPDVACDVPFMVEIPAGLFLMGSDKSVDKLAYDREEPQHPLELALYAIGKYQVTVSQFKRFIEAGGYEEAALWTKAGWEQRQRGEWTEPRYWDDPRWNVPNHPVVGVSWYEAVAYCTWLKAATGRDFRLPDEAMWEKAARGTDGRIWPWGNEWDSSLLNCGETGINRTTAVGAFPGDCSPYGVYDTAGNVREWCSGISYSRAPYPLKQKSYEEDLQADGVRIRRGGAFYSYQRDTRAAYRSDFNPNYWYYDLGFRVAEHLSDPAS